MATKRSKPTCDDCGGKFTQDHPGVLAWWIYDLHRRASSAPRSRRVGKVRLLHHPPMRPEGCHAMYKGNDSCLFDTTTFHPTLPVARIKEILKLYEFSDDDAQWLRETFNVPPPTVEERLTELEEQHEKLKQRVLELERK